MIDPSTVELTATRTSDQKELTLVMSDEFNEDNRSFKPSDDKLFTAIHQPGLTNEELQFYDSSYVTTRDGSLILKTTAEKTHWKEYDAATNVEHEMTRNYTSAMLQSWNQFCFTGGVLEMSIQLPGGSREGVGGMWPAAWMMGNLARAAFPTSTKGVWPWSYDSCDDAVPYLTNRQEINACLSSPGHGMHPHQGRGSPELDIFEVNARIPSSQSKEEGLSKVASNTYMSASLQVSPGVSKDRPKDGKFLNDSFTWYDTVEISDEGEYNWRFWGQECAALNDNPPPNEKYKYWEDAVSANFGLYDTHFQEHHVYRLEWQPGDEGYLEWYLDDDFQFRVGAETLLELTGAIIPVEPMYLVFNTAVSQSWGFPQPCDMNTCSACYKCFDCHNPECQCSLPDSLKKCANLPAEMKIDYIRLYQDPDDVTHTTSCSPPAFPTKQFISDHADRFKPWAPTLPNNNLELDVSTVRHDTLEFALIFVMCAGIIFVISRTLSSTFNAKSSTRQPHGVTEKADHGKRVINEHTSLLTKKTDV